MNIRRPILVVAFAAVILTSPGSAVRSAPIAMPPEIAPHVPRNLETYFVAFAVNPDPAAPRPMPHDLFVRHQAYLRGQVEAGVLRLVGPLTDGGRIRGIKIISATSLDEARSIAEADPAVQEGIMAVEVHPAIFPSLDGLTIEYSPRR